MATMLLYADERGRKARTGLASDTEWSAPEHWTAEVYSVIRDLTLGGRISEDDAAHAIDRLPRVGVERVPIDELLSRMWRMRANVGGYDATYLALAEARGMALVTSDARLARTAIAYCRVELVG